MDIYIFRAAASLVFAKLSFASFAFFAALASHTVAFFEKLLCCLRGVVFAMPVV